MVVPAELLYSSSMRRGWRHGGCSSQSPQHSSRKVLVSMIRAHHFLNSFVVGSAVANSSSACFSPLTTEGVYTESGLSSSDADIYIRVEVPPVCPGVLGEEEEKEKAMLRSGAPYFKEGKEDPCTPNLP